MCNQAPKPNPNVQQLGALPVSQAPRRQTIQTYAPTQVSDSKSLAGGLPPPTTQPIATPPIQDPGSTGQPPYMAVDPNLAPNPPAPVNGTPPGSQAPPNPVTQQPTTPTVPADGTSTVNTPQWGTNGYQEGEAAAGTFNTPPPVDTQPNSIPATSTAAPAAPAASNPATAGVEGSQNGSAYHAGMTYSGGTWRDAQGGYYDRYGGYFAPNGDYLRPGSAGIPQHPAFSAAPYQSGQAAAANPGGVGQPDNRWVGSDPLNTFRSNATWDNPYGNDYVRQQLGTITQQDFNNYSPDQQALIQQILGTSRPDLNYGGGVVQPGENVTNPPPPSGTPPNPTNTVVNSLLKRQKLFGGW